MKSFCLFMVVCIYLCGCDTLERRPRWNVEFDHKYRSGKLIKTDSSIIEYGEHINSSRYYEIIDNTDTFSFPSFLLKTNVRHDTAKLKDTSFELEITTIRDSLEINTEFGNHKNIYGC